MLSGAVLYAKDLEPLAAFYVALGGALVDMEEGEFAVIGHPDNALTIVQAPEKIASQIVLEKPPVPRSETPFKPVVSVHSLEEATRALAAHGGRTHPDSMQWTFRNSLIQDIIDPEGNIVQLRQPA